jgi:serine/threonine protein phosphatase PrpC
MIQRRVPDPGPVLSVTSHGITDRGLVREKNEDQFVVAEIRRMLRIRHSSLSQPDALMGQGLGQLFVVADGMGGHQGGEYASALAVASVENIVLNTIGWLFRLKGEGILAEFQEALRATDRWVIEAAQRQPELKGMGTTLTVAYVTGNVLYLAHAGDSRCYLYRGGKLEQLTRDHTFVAALVQEGVITSEAAAQHTMRNVITNAVGGDKKGVEPEVHKHLLSAGDVLLLCSDGLTEMMSDEEIAKELRTGSRSPEDLCGVLVGTANARGGTDNITVVVARFDSPPD